MNGRRTDREKEAINPTKSIMLVAIVVRANAPSLPRHTDKSLPLSAEAEDEEVVVGACVANRQWTDVARFMTFCWCSA